MTLDDVATLYTREINCGCEIFWDGGIEVWIGDIMNGHHLEMMFSQQNMGMAGQWLVDEAGARERPRAAVELTRLPCLFLDHHAHHDFCALD